MPPRADPVPKVPVAGRIATLSGTRIGFDDLARLPAQRLARLLLDRAAEDPTLLGRLYESIDRDATPDTAATCPLIVGASPAMRHVANLVRRFGQTDDPVLITGESGTGKELLAGAIHHGSCRAHGPFVVVNCAAIPPGLVASELFGYEKGAFTGAIARASGQIEHANGGTLFLDEIGDMPIDLQGHLLRFLQEGQIRRVGGRESINLNVRVVSATNVRLAEAISEGRFREDLFYRLNVLTVPVPPLRERRDDIPPLAEHFLRIAARDFGRTMLGFTPKAMATLLQHRWPGNVRELMSVIRRAVVVTDGTCLDAPDLLGLEDLPTSRSPVTVLMPKPGSREERLTLLATLERTGENISSTADALNVSRVTLYRMLRRQRIVLKRGLAEPPLARRVQHAGS
ncbi:sigma-54 interaction domain-containing protein [Rhodopila sp.]|uniref:sigma-54 interaction domain-containing protein n=1 Tax=Rhodopila sp. TaxID=2480087 RepID=UPI003D10B37F